MFLIEARAFCTECKFELESRNAMGVAAKHHKKTGHYVQMQLVFGQHFGKPKLELSEIDRVSIPMEGL